MGKPKKLRSSIKALHSVLTSFRPAVGAPMCIQPVNTHSFRDLLTSFNSIYYPPPAASSLSASFSDPSSHHSLHHYPQCFPCADISSTYKLDGEEEEAISISATTTTSTTTYSSCLSSSSLAKADAEAADAFPSGNISSERFFFSPCTSKSIMGESFFEMGSKNAEPWCGEPLSAEQYEGEDVFEMLLEREMDILMEGTTRTTRVSSLCRESIPMALSSMDPYRDFRSSMEEMVEAHGLRDWPALQELLHCFLCLNEKNSHRYIVLAFADLVMQLASEGQVHTSAVHGAFAGNINSIHKADPCLLL